MASREKNISPNSLNQSIEQEAPNGDTSLNSAAKNKEFEDAQDKLEERNAIEESLVLQEQHLKSSCPPSKTDLLIFKIFVIFITVISVIDLVTPGHRYLSRGKASKGSKPLNVKG
jgi:hypothetical protein